MCISSVSSVGCYLFIQTKPLQFQLFRDPAFNCESLTIPCNISDINKANAVRLYIDKKMIQEHDMKKNKTECATEGIDDIHKKNCASRMNGSFLDGNNMLFKMDPPWPELNQSIAGCEVRYPDGRENDHHRKRIDYHYCQATNNGTGKPTGKPTVTKNTERPECSTEKPPNSDSNGDDNCRTVVIILSVLLVFFFFTSAVLLGLLIYRRKSKKRHNKLPCNNDEENENKPRDEISMDVVTNGQC
ncbi:uncharacterized protein LOC116290001 [Actinia tenebrosa]|uniref:Uncharacterized protein LOC116290001 n=1 Tax=Actinia tenebrosa TaxID=6105 RepID=A0A6P8HCM4_ACTTE|nr:uncharacterized protein LOC116290001 [Actinia tenebrosa]XP_031552828.1 uncharacterized protein LOC116290001 [Actinia tenebrosa]